MRTFKYDGSSGPITLIVGDFAAELKAAGDTVEVDAGLAAALEHRSDFSEVLVQSAKKSDTPKPQE